MWTSIRGWGGGEYFPRQAGTAADVEDEGGGFYGEEFQSAIGHFDLHILDSGGSGVFAGFGVVVEEVGGAVGALSNVGEWGDGGEYSLSSGRDIVGVGRGGSGGRLASG